MFWLLEVELIVITEIWPIWTIWPNFVLFHHVIMAYHDLRTWLESVSLFLELIKKVMILGKGVALSQVWTNLIISALFFEGIMSFSKMWSRMPIHLLNLFADTFETFLEFFQLIAIIWKFSVDKIEHKFFKFPHFFTQIVQPLIIYIGTCRTGLFLMIWYAF